MTDTDSIKTIEQRNGVARPVASAHAGDLWPLDEWYLRVYDLPFVDYSERDLGIAIRQQLHSEIVIPIVLNLLEVDPLAGFGYSGELIESLRCIDSRFWLSHPQLVQRLHNILVSIPSDSGLQTERLIERINETVRNNNLNEGSQ